MLEASRTQLLGLPPGAKWSWLRSTPLSPGNRAKPLTQQWRAADPTAIASSSAAGDVRRLAVGFGLVHEPCELGELRRSHDSGRDLACEVPGGRSVGAPDLRHLCPRRSPRTVSLALHRADLPSGGSPLPAHASEHACPARRYWKGTMDQEFGRGRAAAIRGSSR